MQKLIGPKIGPQDTKYGFRPQDTHIIVNDGTETAKAFDGNGAHLWTLPALAKGVGGPDWRYWSADTPPGLYLLGEAYDDKWRVDHGQHVEDRIKLAYGWVTFDMISLEGQEPAAGRDGICLHGGGSTHGWAAWNQLQPYLAPTYGCVRMHNIHLYEKVFPLYRKGRVFLSVWQDLESDKLKKEFA